MTVVQVAAAVAVMKSHDTGSITSGILNFVVFQRQKLSWEDISCRQLADIHPSQDPACWSYRGV